MVFEAIAAKISIGASTTGADRAAAALDDVADEATQTGAAAAAASAGVDSLGDELGETGGIAALARGRIDELGDELTQLGGKAAAAAAGMTGFSAATTGAAGATATLRTSIVATLIPSLVSLSGAAGTAAVALGGIGTAAGAVATGATAVVGSGLLAYSKDLADANREELRTTRQKVRALEQLREENGSLTAAQRQQLQSLQEQAATLEDATTKAGALERRFGQLKSTIAQQLLPVGEQFDGLIREFVNGLPDVTQAVIDNLGPLDMFAQAIRDAGTAAANALPGIVRDFLDIGRASLPVLRDLVAWTGERLPGTLRQLRSITADVVPEFTALGKALLGLTGDFLEFGRIVTNAVIPPITDLIRRIEGLFETFNDLPEPVQDAAAKFAVFAPAVIGGATAISGLSKALVPVIGLFTRFIPLVARVAGPLGLAASAVYAVSQNFLGLRDDLELVVGAFRDQLQPTIKTFEQTVVPIFNDIASAFGGTETTISQSIDRLATAFAEDLAGGIRRAGEQVRQGLRDIKGYWDQNRTQILQTVRDLGTGVRERFQTLRKNATRIMRQAKNALVGEFRQALPEMRSNADRIVTDVTKSFDTLIPMFRGLMNFILSNIIRPTLSTMAELWDQHGSKIMSSVTQLTAFLTRAFRGATNVIRAVWDTWGTEITGITRFVIDLIGSTIKTGLDFIISTFDIVTDLLVGDWDTAWDKIVSGTKDFLNGLVSFVKRWGQGWLEYMDQLLGDTIEDWVQWALDVGKTVRDAFNDIGAWINNKGRQLFGDAWTAVIDKITELWNGFYQWIIGGSFIPDLIRDITDYVASTGVSLIEGAFQAVVDGVMQIFELWKVQVLGVIANTVTGIADYVSSVGRSAISSAWGTVTSAIEDILNGIDLSGITESLNGIISSAQDAINKLADIPNEVSTTITVDRVINTITGSIGGDEDEDDGGYEPPDNDGDESDDGDQFTGGFTGDDDEDRADPRDTGGGYVGLHTGGVTSGEGLARLHPNEVVLGQKAGAKALIEEMRRLNEGDGGGGTNIVIEEGAIQAPGGDPDEIFDELERRLQRLYPNA